jgi:hypothetical protein
MRSNALPPGGFGFVGVRSKVPLAPGIISDSPEIGSFSSSIGLRI